MARVRSTLTVFVVLVWAWSTATASPTPSFSQQLAGTVTDAGTDHPKRLRLRLKAVQGDPAASVTGWGHWGAGSSWLAGSVTGGASPTLLVWLADDRARLCTLTGVPQPAASASFAVVTVAGAYACIDYTGAPAGTGTFTLRRPPRPRPSGPVGMPGY